jgi:hypothetical protein
VIHNDTRSAKYQIYILVFAKRSIIKGLSCSGPQMEAGGNNKCVFNP